MKHIFLITLLLLIPGSCSENNSSTQANTNNPTQQTIPSNLKKYSDATVNFLYPKDWIVNNTAQGIQITPNNTPRDQQNQPMEVISLLSTSSDGITALSDARVTEFFDKQINQLFGPLQREKNIDHFSASLGPAIGLTYAGTSRINIQAKVAFYCSLKQDQAIILMHAGRQDLYLKHSRQAKEIFKTLVIKANDSSPKQASATKTSGQREQGLVGTWYRNESSGSSGYGSTYVGADTRTKVTFNPDGKFAYGSGTVVFGGTDGGYVHSGDRNTNMSYGTWTSKKGLIQVKWQDGSNASFQYGLFNHQGSIALWIMIDGQKKYFQR